MTMAWLDPAREEFRNRLQSDRLAHAFLLSGQTGTGKQGLVMEMAAALLCLEKSLPACGSCRSCQLLASGAHPDFRILSFELNDKGKLRSEIVIDQVRELISFLQLTTTISEKKVALIQPAEAMNKNAANALLKTLEEPPGDAVILLLSHDPSRLRRHHQEPMSEVAGTVTRFGNSPGLAVGNGCFHGGRSNIRVESSRGKPLSGTRIVV